MTRIVRRTLLAITAASIVAGVIPLAHAQVSEVVVTARKREENVQNIPIAVTAISGKQLQQYNISSIEDVALKTPQLIIARGSSGSGADITLRGIGSSLENIGIEQSVSVNVDGVYYGQGRAIDEGTFDVSGVQILKGPQALFYGKNATAGAIAIQTNDPGSHYEAGLTAGYEFNAEEPYVEGFASAPVTDRFGLRLAFRLSEQFNGYLKQTAPVGVYHTFDSATGTANSGPTSIPPTFLGGQKDAMVRLTAKWDPIDRLTITGKASFDQHKSNNNADNTVDVYCPLGYPQSEGSLPASERTTCGRAFQAPQPALPIEIASVPGSLEGKAGGQDFEHYQDGDLYLKINYVAPNFTLTSTNAGQHLFNDWADNQNFTAAPLVYAGEHFVWDAFSTEERFLTTFHFPLNFAGGVYFQTTSLNFNQDVDFAGAQNSAAAPLDEFVAYNKYSRTVGHTYAVFGQAIWDIIPTLEATAGARYTHEIKSSFFRQPYVWPPLYGLFIQYDPANPTAGGGVCNCNSVGAHQVFNNVSPEFTLTWRPKSDLTLYGAYKTGYKSGGFSNSAILSTGTAQGDLQFRPETAKGFEFGVKSIWFDHQLRVNADVFDFLYSDLQVDFFNTPTFNYITLNATSARTYGFEYQVEYAPKSITGLVLRLDGAYDNSHYGQFEAPCSPAGLTYEQGCNSKRIPQADGSSVFTPNCGESRTNLCNFMNVNGRPTDLAPKWTELVGADYTREIGSGLQIVAGVDARISSGYVANPFPSDVTLRIDHQGAYGMLDAAVSLGSTNGRWQVSVIGRNLTNTFVATGSAGLPLSGGMTGCQIAVCGPQLVSDQAVTVLNPRTVAIQISARY